MYIFKKVGKMDRLERKIMLCLLVEEQSIYKLEKSLVDTNYPTVWRRIKEMQNEGLVEATMAIRKNGKKDGRETNVLKLTNKGLATLLIDGDLGEDEIICAGKRLIEKGNFEVWSKSLMAEVFKNSLISIRPKVNLKYFDEKWFREIFLYSTIDAVEETIKKNKDRLVKQGVWASDEELQREGEELIDALSKMEGFELKE